LHAVGKNIWHVATKKSWAKVILFGDMRQYMMLLNDSMSSIWIQNPMNGDSVSNQNPSLYLFQLQAMPHFCLPLVKVEAIAHCNQEILGKSDAVWRHMTVYDDAAEPLHVLHMDTMSDESVSNQIMSPSCFQFQAMPLFCMQLEKPLALCNQKILGKSDAVWRYVTVYDGAEPFHVLHMDPGSNEW
jgi:hypothetical protein